MHYKTTSDTTYHRTWLMVILAVGYSAIAFSMERAASGERKEQRSTCTCSLYPHVYVFVVFSTAFGDGQPEHPENNTCGLIIKHPIGDMERRVNHLGEYHE